MTLLAYDSKLRDNETGAAPKKELCLAENVCLHEPLGGNSGGASPGDSFQNDH